MAVIASPTRLSRREVGEWAIRSLTDRGNPFVDVTVTATFGAPDGRQFTIPAFFDGEQTWRARFSPDQPGEWSWSVEATPTDPHLAANGTFHVSPSDSAGMVTVTPDRNWGLSFEDGSPALVFGDTVYNLFAMAHCGYDVDGFLRRRAEQGFTLLRVRIPVSPFHPTRAYSRWQNRRCFAWEGVEQHPLFDRFNLEWFATVDSVVQRCQELGLGLEMIMEAWGFEFPFNARSVFTPEWEDLWLRYLVARYDAYPCVWIWTPLNEYENYPHGKPIWSHEADRWLLRVSALIDDAGCHHHIVAAHNGPTMPPFARRFAAAPERVPLIMFQEWGTFDEQDGWLTAGIEESMQRSFEGWTGARVLAEWGYERNPEFELDVPWHEHMGVEHTRRGAWRAVFQASGLVHGFENTWGPWCVLDTDQAGMQDLLVVRRFLTEVDATRLDVVTGIFGAAETDPEPGRRVRVLASSDRSLVAAYLPVGGRLTVPGELCDHRLEWFDPRTGERAPGLRDGAGTAVPPTSDEPRDDWVALFSLGGDGEARDDQ
jgi:Protein of unknown function (DUF4038)/Domain of unknown function (DUF5060)